ncbi:MAG TPA: DoxX family protein [Terriglobales bacterium]|nr:DoxX family protein [Terriglobales bacterium]
MNHQPASIVALRWAVGVVVLVEALHFALSPVTAAHFARTDLPLWIRPALGWLEAVAAILFLVPATRFVGGCTLLLTFAAAVALHLHLGDYGFGALIVYAATVIACMADHERRLGNNAA